MNTLRGELAHKGYDIVRAVQHNLIISTKLYRGISTTYRECGLVKTLRRVRETCNLRHVKFIVEIENVKHA